MECCVCVCPQSLSCVWFFETPQSAAHQASLPFTLSKFSQTHVHWVSDAIQPSCPLLPLFPPALNLSFLASGSFPRSRLFTSGGPSIGVRFSISPSNKYSGLISFRLDWLDLLAVQGTLKSLLQHHSSRASTVQHSVFFMVQLTSIHAWLLEKPSLWLDGP